MRKVELLPTRDCEAGYGPGSFVVSNYFVWKVTFCIAKVMGTVTFHVREVDFSVRFKLESVGK